MLTDDKLLYHASHNGIKGNISPVSRHECDFGAGFYMSNRPKQTIGLVLKDEAPRKYILKLNKEKSKDLKILNLTKTPEDWFYVVMFNRGVLEDFKGTDLYEKYEHFFDDVDIVIGQIADDSLAPAIEQFQNGIITDIVALNCIKEINIGIQVVTKTIQGCQAIDILEDEPITQKDREQGKNFKKWKEEQSIGIIARNNIKFKGQGSYISELLAKARELNQEEDLELFE